MKFRGLVLSIAMLASTLMAFSQERTVTAPRAGATGAWRLIGTTEAGFSADHDTIAVAGPFVDFRRIKFKVTGADLTLNRLVITYESGQPHNMAVRQNIPEGGESRQIDLPSAGRRRIRRNDFWYDTKGLLKGKAKVTLFGIK
jgi:hypothetical protein